MSITAPPSNDITTATTATTTVMSCSARVVVGDLADQTDPSQPACLGRRAIDRLHELEAMWSRFLPDSEISRLNAGAGRPMEVSSETMRLVTAMVQAWWSTDGAYDPTLLRPIVELGYATSRVTERHRTTLPPGLDERGRPDRVLIDVVRSVVQLPPGTALDPGGIGKGLAADIVSDEAMAAGALGALIEIGGDLRVRGVARDGVAWTIDAAGTSVTLADGGVATSSTERRTWQHESETRHHLVDPRTLRPASTDVVECTVVAGTGAGAETFTKIAFMDPIDRALVAYERHGLAVAIKTDDGRRHTSSAWNDFGR